MDTLKKFIEKFERDETLKADFKNLVDEKDGQGIINLLRNNNVSEKSIEKLLEASLDNEELSSEDLDMVNGAGQSYDMRSNIIIFQKHVNPDWDMETIAWKVIKNCGQSWQSNQPFKY